MNTNWGVCLPLLITTVTAFFTYAPRPQSYPITPVPLGYQPPPNPPERSDLYGAQNQWNPNQNQWRAQNQAWPQPAKPEPALIKTLIQVFARENDPNSLYSETTTLTKVDGNQRVQISRELDTKSGNFLPLNRAEFAANPTNFAHVKAFAATNSTHISDADLEKELDRALETAIPLILDELDRIAQNNNITTTPHPDDISAKDLEKLIEDALTSIDDPQKRKEAQDELDKIRSITKPTSTTKAASTTSGPQTSTTLAAATTTTPPSTSTATTTTTAEQLTIPEAEETAPPLIIFEKTTQAPEISSEPNWEQSAEEASHSTAEAGEPAQSTNPSADDTLETVAEVTSTVAMPEAELIVPEHAANGDQAAEHGRTWKPRPGSGTTAIPTHPASSYTPALTIETPAKGTVAEGGAVAACPVPNDPGHVIEGDVLFLLDASRTAANGHFGAGLALIADTVKHFRHVGEHGIQVSLLQYSDEPFLEFSFRKHNCIVDLLDDVKDTVPKQGPPDLEKAIDKVLKFAFTKSRGDRPNAPNILVLIADDQPEGQVQLPAELLRKDDTSVIVIASVHGDKDDLVDLAKHSEVDVLDLSSVNEKPLAERLADKIYKVLSGNSKALSSDVAEGVGQGSATIPHDATNVVVHDDDEPSHHLPSTYSGENVEIECHGDGVQAVFKVPEYFSGFISTKGFENDKECSKEISQNHPDSEALREVAFSVRSGQCGLTSVSSISPRGRNHSVVINLFHHKDLTTEQDQSYVVQCFIPRRHVEHTLETKLDIDEPLAVSKTIALGAVPPTCEYTLRRDSPNGPVLTTASIGQIVYHRWECKANEEVTSAFGLHVHDCRAFNGTDHSYEIIDSQGCAADNSLLGEVVYADDQILAHVRSHVFTFVNVESLLFSCRVSLCLRDGDGCEGYAPPVCQASHPPDLLLTRRTRHLEKSIEEALTQQVHTPTLGLVDMKRPARYYRIPHSTILVLPFAITLVGLIVCVLCMGRRSQHGRKSAS